MRHPLVAGNWKMHGSRESSGALVDEIVAALPTRAEVALLPPFVYVSELVARCRRAAIAFGAQDLSEHGPGAHTGDIAGAMLKDIGCTYVLVGHSERRRDHGESDGLVAAKFVAAQTAALVPILCVGESAVEHDAGHSTAVVGRQLDAVLARAGIGAFTDAVVAYEPIWAIGTGKTATPAQAQAMHAFIRDKLAGQDATIADSLRLLYGGSVKPANAAELFGQPDVDGGLIGGASLVASEFVAICAAVEK